MRALYHINAGGDVHEAWRLAEAASREPADRGLQLLLLGLWASVAHHFARPDEVRAIVNRGRALVSPRSPRELRALQTLAEGQLELSAGNVSAATRHIREAAEALPPESALGKRAGRQWLSLLGQVGRLEEGRDRIELYGVDRWTLMDNCIQTGEVEKAAGHLAALTARDREGRLGAKERLRWAGELIELLAGRWRPPAEFSGYGGEAGCLRSTHALFGGRPEEALRWARGDVEDVINWFQRLGFHAYTLIRAELSSGHGEAARRLIQEHWRRGAANYIDDFFLARIELLAGREEAAARHLAAAVRACELHGAGRRLAVELRLSCELAPDAVFALTRAAERLLAGGEGRRGARPPSGPDGASEPSRGVPDLRGVARLVGVSRATAALRETVRKMAPLDAPVLIAGETGTGKELVARALHEEGPRAAEPFLAINCAAISEGLLESELFGHQKGAFTGAHRARRGVFEAAGAGTVLLDEIGEVSPRLQAALLRVLESGEIQPVGGAELRRLVRCRILAATNADLEALAAAGRFRQDLLFRLKRLALAALPLRERPEDVVPLAEHFLDLGRPAGRRARMTPELMAALRSCEWRGNVRELRNLVEKMRLLNSDKLDYDLADLDPAPDGPAPREPVPTDSANPPAPGVPAAGSAAAAVENLPEGRIHFRRQERLRSAFSRHGRLTRTEAMKLLEVSGDTATKDLRALIAAGAIEKVEPTASPRTHYFRLRS